jgi:WD40 repeat protein
VNGARLSKDEARVLTWSNDKNARVFDLTSPVPLRTFPHRAAVTGAWFIGDGSRVLTRSEEFRDTYYLWDVANPAPIQVLEGFDGGIFNQNITRALGSFEGKLGLWDIDGAKPIHTFNSGPERDSLTGAVFSRDESRVLEWSKYGNIRLFDVNKVDPIQTFTLDLPGSEAFEARFNGDETRVLAWASNQVRLRGLASSDPIQSFKHKGSARGACFNRDESRVLTWGSGGVLIFDTTKPDPILTLELGGAVEGAKFNEDESRVLAWTKDNVYVWDLTDPLATLTPAERLLELEVRTATSLDSTQGLQHLKPDEWLAKIQSEAYRWIAAKLAASTAGQESSRP